MSETLLAIETATQRCSVALLQADRVTVELSLSRPRLHAEQLVPLIRDALRYGGVEAAALDAVAVSKGPGSYTGLRIGASTAKGLAVATGAALIGVPTLEALAASVASFAETGDLVLAALDARRDEVYAAAYRVETDGVLSPAAETAALETDDLPGWLDASSDDGGCLWLVGPGAAKAALAFSNTANVRLLDAEKHAPSAAWVGRCALPRLRAGTVEDVAAFEPHYLKEFVATPRKGSVFDSLP